MKLVVATSEQNKGAAPRRHALLLAMLASAFMPLIIVLLFIHGLLFIRDVHDLRLVDVRLVEPSAVDAEFSEETAYDRPPSQRLGRIDIATRSDLVGKVAASEATLGPGLTICQTGAEIVHYGLSYQGVELSDVGLGGELPARYLDRAAGHRPAEPYIYQIYFEPRWTRSPAQETEQPMLYKPYDFTLEPQDLCLGIGGRNILGVHFTSNTIVVPSAALKRAFEGIPE